MANNEKEKLYIKFEDLNNTEDTFNTFFNLCNFLVKRYSGSPTDELEQFIVNTGVYFGYLLQLMGYKNGKDNGQKPDFE